MSGDSSLESLDGQYSDDHSAQETGNESEEYSDDEGGHCMYRNEPEYTAVLHLFYHLYLHNPKPEKTAFSNLCIARPGVTQLWVWDVTHSLHSFVID